MHKHSNQLGLGALEKFATSFRADYRFGPVNIMLLLVQSRIILSTAETEIAQKFADASTHYQQNPAALHLRAMNMVFEGLKQKGSMIIVPSTAVETMGLGAMGGLTAFDRILGEQQAQAEATPATGSADAPPQTPDSPSPDAPKTGGK